MVSGFDEYRMGTQFGLTAEQVEIADSAGKYFMSELFPLQQRMDDQTPADAAWEHLRRLAATLGGI